MIEFPNLAYGPERLFGVRDLAYAEPGVVGEMVLADESLGPAALSVLVDDVLGYAILSGSPTGSWSVSTEIAMDLVGHMPAAGGLLRAEGQLVDCDRTGGLALGRILDTDGRVIAHCRQRGRYVPPPVLVDKADADVVGPVSHLLGLDSLDEASSGLDLKVALALANPLGNLHGGIALAVSERLASHALRQGPALTTASIHIAYARSVPAQTVARFTAEVVHRGRSLGIARVTSLGLRGLPSTVATVVQH